MTGFGPTARLLEHNPIPKHPWLNQVVVDEEVAIQAHNEDVIELFAASTTAAEPSVHFTDWTPKTVYA